MRKITQTLRVASAVIVGAFSGGMLNTLAAYAYTAPSPTTPVASITICHATGSNNNPYVPNSPSTSGTGIGGGNGDHAAHTGTTWSPGMAANSWGDIIPPFTDMSGRVFGGLNWDADGQLIYANNCAIPTVDQAPTATYSVTPCTESDTTDTVTVTVTNTNDVSDATITYNVTLNGVAPKTVTIADGMSGSVTFTGLAAGTYTATINGDSATITLNNIVVNACQAPEPAEATLEVIDTACSVDDNGLVTVRITNTADETEASSDYKWYVTQGDEVIVEGRTGQVADDDYADVTVGDLAAGDYTFMIRADDGTETATDFTIEECAHKVTICHRTESIRKPYNKIAVDAASVDGDNGNDHGRGDHYLDHTGPIYNKDNMTNDDTWGDIIPPVAGHDGLNWDVRGQYVLEHDCNVPADSSGQYVLEPCVAASNLSDSVKVSFTNTADDTEGDVTYTVTMMAANGTTIAKTVTLADGGSGSVVFKSLVAGTYALSVNASDGTVFETDDVTVELCASGGNALGDNDDAKPHILAAAVLPAKLPATGGSNNPFLIIIAALSTYGALYFAQGRRRIDQPVE